MRREQRSDKVSSECQPIENRFKASYGTLHEPFFLAVVPPHDIRMSREGHGVARHTSFLLKSAGKLLHGPMMFSPLNLVEKSMSCVLGRQ